MIDHDTLLEVMKIGEQRRTARRNFLKTAGVAIAAAGGASMLAACDDDDNENQPAPGSPTPAPTTSVSQNDIDILNFALTLEYLEANYYISAVTGSTLNGNLRTGTGTQGEVVGGRAVNFTDPTVASYAREIASDENQHVVFLRGQLGSAAVAMPAINIDGTTATGAFAVAARAAGVANAAGLFDPYANDDNWLLGGMLLTDVGVTAYKGAARFINSGTILEASAGILAVEAYHSGLIRTLLYRRGIAMPNDRTYAGRISDARDSLDGTTDLDQGIVGDATTSNIVPSDSDGIVFGRSTAQVLNIVYLNTTAAAATTGGFFPNGINGNIRTGGRT